MWDPRNTLELAGTAPPLRSFVQLALHQHGLLESDVPESDLFPVLTEQWHHQNCLQRQIPCDKPFSGAEIPRYIPWKTHLPLEQELWQKNPRRTHLPWVFPDTPSEALAPQRSYQQLLQQEPFDQLPQLQLEQEFLAESRTQSPQLLPSLH